MANSNKRGTANLISVLPEAPTGAQFRGGYSGSFHVQFPDGTYLRTLLPLATPDTRHDLAKAIEACPQEPSYSGTGRMYYRLDVAVFNDETAVIKAGTAVIGSLRIDPVQGAADRVDLGSVVTPAGPKPADDDGDGDDDDDDGDLSGGPDHGE